MANFGVISETSRFRKRPSGKPGGLLILGRMPIKKATDVTGGGCAIRRLPDTPPGSDKNIDNNNC